MKKYFLIPPLFLSNINIVARVLLEEKLIYKFSPNFFV